MSTITPPRTDGAPDSGDVARYVDAQDTLAATRSRVEALEGTEGVESFNRQLELLKRRLVAEPRAFRELFVADGMQAVAWEFNQPELSKEFTERLWAMLLRDDDVSKVLMRFVWNLPLGKKRTFIRGIDAHLSDRYPMFAGLSVAPSRQPSASAGT